MGPLRPYLVKAYFDWIVDNDMTPYLVVNAEFPHVDVPHQFVQDGQITLNISPSATGSLALGDEAVEFSARFSGKIQHLYVPMGAIIALFAKETGAGTGFPEEEAYAVAEEAMEEVFESTNEPVGFSPQVVDSGDSDDDPEEPPPAKKGKPSLKVIK